MADADYVRVVFLGPVLPLAYIDLLTFKQNAEEAAGMPWIPSDQSPSEPCPLVSSAGELEDEVEETRDRIVLATVDANTIPS